MNPEAPAFFDHQRIITGIGGRDINLILLYQFAGLGTWKNCLNPG
jgi:hypothetical protein